MSLLDEAFENTIALNDSLLTPFKDIQPVVPIIDEPIYIDSTTQSGISASNINKRVNNLRVTQEGSTQLQLPTTSATPVLTEVLPFLARITGYTSRMGSWKWYYFWEAVIPETQEGTSFIEGVYSGLIHTENTSVQTRAINIMEDGNEENCVAPGVCLDCDYPEEWEPQPIGGATCSTQPVVVMYQMTVGGAAPTYIFQAENSHDGTCPEGTGDPQP